MSIVMDVAYLDVPYVAHVPRRAVLQRMSPPCWEDSCHGCQDARCICACHPSLGGAARCEGCGLPVGAVRHLVTCEPEALEALDARLASGIGGGR